MARLSNGEWLNGMTSGVLGKPYSTNDCVRFLKETYNIDFEESMYGRKTL